MMRQSRVFMRLDFLKPRQVLYVNLALGILLLLAIIIGAVGPQTYISATSYSFNCGQEGNHLGSPCQGGVDLSNTSVSLYLKNGEAPISIFNQFFGVALAPYSMNDDRSFQVKYELFLFGLDSNQTWVPLGKKEGDAYFSCLNSDQHDHRCTFDNVLGVSNIEYSFYSMEFRFVEENCSEQICLHDWMKDVEFRTFVIQETYTRFQVGVKTTGVIISSVIFCWYFIRMRNHWRPDLTGFVAPASEDQKWIGLFLALLILENDPFYSLRLVTNGWFLDTLFTFIQVLFDYFFLIYWLIAVDRVNQEKKNISKVAFYLPKFIITGIWAFLSFISLSWLRGRHIYDPLIAQDPVFTGQIYPMLVVSEIIYFLVIIWIAYLIVSSWEETSSKFFYIGFPTFLYITSVLVAMFSGVTKDIHTSAVSFLYYYTLKNAYVYVLLFGYWPLESLGHYASNPIGSEEANGEGQKLIGSQKNPFTFTALKD